MTPLHLSTIMRNDFQACLEKSFNILHSHTPFEPNWHHRVIAWNLLQVAEGKITRLAICLPPRHLKSTIASVAFPAWLLGRDPFTKIICASYGEDLAKMFSTQSRDILLDKAFRKAFPDLKLVKSTEHYLRTDKGGYRFSTTIGGALTGIGADVIIVDDPLKMQDADSEVQREAVKDWMATLPTRLDNPKKGAIVLVMHRLHEDDPVGGILEKDGWTVLNLPAQAQQDTFHQYGPNLVHLRNAGSFLHSDRFGPEEAGRTRLEITPRWYEALYNQNPLPLGSDLFDLGMVGRYDTPPVCDYIFFSVDVATIANAGDYSVCTIWGHAQGKFYLLDVWRKQVTVPQLRDAIVALDKKWNPHIIAIETIGSGISLAQDLEKTLGFYVKGCTPHGSKAHRFEAVTLMIANGRVFIPNNAPWLETYLKELLAFPNGKYDDQVDSTSQLLHYADTALMYARQGRNPRSAKPANGGDGWGGNVRIYSLGGGMPDLW